MRILFSIGLFSISILFPILSQSKNKSVELILPDSGKSESVWGETGELMNLEILKRIDGKTSESKLEEAALHFRKAIEFFHNTEKAIDSKKEEYAISSFPEDRYDWQKRSRKDSHEREISKILLDGRGISIQHLIKAMNAIDSIENPRIINSDAYKDLRAGLYREFIKHQFAMKNYQIAMNIANRYILLDDRFYKEAEPHRILAVCYEKNEEAAKKIKNHDQTMIYKEKKKHHLITFAEIHYGKDSIEYQAILEKIERDY